jgi:hypothetical protein
VSPRGSNTSLDARGLRHHCPDNHLLYWPAAQNGVDYSRQGLAGGICTAGHGWDQDAAHSVITRPGRLRRQHGEPALLDGVGYVRAELKLIPGEEHRIGIEIMCRRGHALLEMIETAEFEATPTPGVLPVPDAKRGESVETFLPKLASWIERNGWSWQERVECPEHRAEREHTESVLNKLRAQEAASAPRPGVRRTQAPKVALAIGFALLALSGATAAADTISLDDDDAGSALTHAWNEVQSALGVPCFDPDADGDCHE